VVLCGVQDGILNEAKIMKYFNTIAHELLHGIDASLKKRHALFSERSKLMVEGRTDYVSVLMAKMVGQPPRGDEGYWADRIAIKKLMMVDDISDSDVLRTFFPHQPKRLRKWMKKAEKTKTWDKIPKMLGITNELVYSGEELNKKISEMIKEDPGLIENNKILKQANEILKDVSGDQYIPNFNSDIWQQQVVRASVIWELGDLGNEVKETVVGAASAFLWTMIQDKIKTMRLTPENEEGILKTAEKWDDFRHGREGRRESVEMVKKMLVAKREKGEAYKATPLDVLRTKPNQREARKGLFGRVTVALLGNR
jgi:hypothetical protein